MMLDSDDEDDDTLGELPPPQSKKRREENDLASGPKDFIQALVDAGFYPRSGNLPNLLSNLDYFVNICK